MLSQWYRDTVLQVLNESIFISPVYHIPLTPSTSHVYFHREGTSEYLQNEEITVKCSKMVVLKKLSFMKLEKIFLNFKTLPSTYQVLKL